MTERPDVIRAQGLRQDYVLGAEHAHCTATLRAGVVTSDVPHEDALASAS